MIRFHRAAPVYPVDHVEATVNWFIDKLGFRALHVNRSAKGHEPANYAVLQRDDVAFHVIRRAEAGVEMAHAESYVVVSELYELHARLVAGGVCVDQPPQRKPWGVVDFCVRDPEGNRFWFSEPVGEARS